MKWYSYDYEKWANQNLPEERRYVLLQFPGDDAKGTAPTVGVGYLRYAAGDKNSPQFIRPGIDKPHPVAWCDCLGDEFKAPMWGDGCEVFCT